MATEYNITIDQSATFIRTFKWTDSANVPVPLVGATAKMHVRPNKETLVVNPTPTVELTTANGGIILSDGTIKVIMPAIETHDLTNPVYVYDLFITHQDGTVTKLLFGRITINKAVTEVWP